MIGLLEVFRKNAELNKKKNIIKENTNIDVIKIRRKSRFIGFESNLRRKLDAKDFS